MDCLPLLDWSEAETTEEMLEGAPQEPDPLGSILPPEP